MSSNWSCILFEKNIVIHCEESNAAFQHFYPIPLLRKYKWKMANESSSPFLYGRLPPARTLSKRFTFPKLNAPPVVINHMHFEGDPNGFGGFANAILTPGGLLLPLPPDIAANLDAGLADGGAVDLAQLLTPQQLEQLFAQAPLFALLPPGQNHQQLLVQAGLEPGAPLPAQLAANLGHPAASATQPANGGAVGQATVNGDHTNNTSEDTEEDEEDGEDQPNQGNEQGNGFSNPFPFPWYPESAHFVRQWWPTLPGVPRVSCTVVLLAAHDPQTHATRFVLAQHYFRVPLDWKSWKESQPMAECAGNHQGKGKRKQKQKRKRRNVNGKARGDENLNNERHRSSTPLSNGTLSEDLGEGPSSPSYRADERQLTSDTCDTDYDSSSEDEAECECGWAGERYENLSETDDNDNSMKMWYVSTPFDVVCVSDMDEEDGQQVERPRPLIAVDFGHAVWIEDGEDGEDRDSETLGSEDGVEPSQEENISSSPGGADQQGEEGSPPNVQADPKRLRFVTFPPYDASSPGPSPGEGMMEGEVRTLKVPDDLDLDSVETINIDQSQGAVILSVRDGKIFILCYE